MGRHEITQLVFALSNLLSREVDLRRAGKEGMESAVDHKRKAAADLISGADHAFYRKNGSRGRKRASIRTSNAIVRLFSSYTLVSAPDGRPSSLLPL